MRHTVPIMTRRRPCCRFARVVGIGWWHWVLGVGWVCDAMHAGSSQGLLRAALCCCATDERSQVGSYLGWPAAALGSAGSGLVGVDALGGEWRGRDCDYYLLLLWRRRDSTGGV